MRSKIDSRAWNWLRNLDWGVTRRDFGGADAERGGGDKVATVCGRLMVEDVGLKLSSGGRGGSSSADAELGLLTRVESLDLRVWSKCSKSRSKMASSFLIISWMCLTLVMSSSRALFVSSKSPPASEDRSLNTSPSKSESESSEPESTSDDWPGSCPRTISKGSSSKTSSSSRPSSSCSSSSSSSIWISTLKWF